MVLGCKTILCPAREFAKSAHHHAGPFHPNWFSGTTIGFCQLIDDKRKPEAGPA